MIKSFLLLIVGFACLLVHDQSFASEKLLNQFFKQVGAMSAHFEEQIVDDRGMTLEKNSGEFHFLRPGKFLWDYDSLEPEIIEQGKKIIADGRVITMYDPDLESATQFSMSNALSQVPTLILVQGGGNIEEHFTVVDVGLTDGLSWVTLRPIDEDAGFQQLMLGFSGEFLKNIIFIDAFSNETKLKLSNVKNNPNLTSNMFDFRAPEGTDIEVR